MCSNKIQNSSDMTALHYLLPAEISSMLQVPNLYILRIHSPHMSLIPAVRFLRSRFLMMRYSVSGAISEKVFSPLRQSLGGIGYYSADQKKWYRVVWVVALITEPLINLVQHVSFSPSPIATVCQIPHRRLLRRHRDLRPRREDLRTLRQRPQVDGGQCANILQSGMHQSILRLRSFVAPRQRKDMTVYTEPLNYR